MIKEIRTDFSVFSIHLEKGAQWLRLGLKSPHKDEILEVLDGYDEKENFFLTGCFLMFPFVNRSEFQKFNFRGQSYDFSSAKTDSNHFPIHGFICDTPRKILEEEKVSPAKIKICPKIFPDTNLYPKISEVYELSESKLKVTTKFKNESGHIQFFAFGYHPYFRLGNSIDDCAIETNLALHYPLDERLLPDKKALPNEEFFKSKNTPIKSISLDHTMAFRNNDEFRFFSIVNQNSNLRLTISTEKSAGRTAIDLKFFQLYTPPHRKSIAVEPMSSTGNSFFFEGSCLEQILPGEEKTSTFEISLQKYR